MKTKGWGFDKKDIDQGVRPQDDFYQYAGGSWLKRNPVPKSESRWGTFTRLRKEVDENVHKLVEGLGEKKKYPVGSDEQLIRDLYLSGMDMEARAKAGLQALTPYFDRIDAIQTVEDLVWVIAHLHRVGVGVIWGSGVDLDSKNSEKYALHLAQDGLGMPEREYYLNKDAESVRVREAYKEHIVKLFKLLKDKNIEKKRDIIISIERQIAEISMTKEDRRDVHKTYNKKTVSELQKLSPSIDWNLYLKVIGASKASYVIVMHTSFFRALSPLLSKISIEEWKVYLRFHVLNDFAGYLSVPFVKENFHFYGTVMYGMTKMKPLWRRTLSVVTSCLGEPLGKIYVRHYFSEAAKKKMKELVNDLFVAYKERINSLTWMSTTTKKKAQKKLKAMNPKIGYPDKWRSYKGLRMDKRDFLGNVIRAVEHEHDRQIHRIKKSVDRKEWFAYPQEVNAYFAPNLNDLVFPAGILQPPFFSIDADDAVNYGCIGAVIGHEITHGFDDQGSNYDEKGNIKSWWTKEDRKRFMRKARIVEKQFDEYTVADGVKVNGKLTLGENIADFGGLAIAYDAYLLRLQKTGRVIVDGFTPEQRFFLAFNTFEKENVRPEFQKTAARTDVHSPGKYRINGSLANLDPFYEAFGVTKGDKMYRPKNIRTTVW